MKLDELQKKLYKPEAEFEDRLEGPEAFDIDRKREKKDVAQEWQKIEKRQLSPQWKKKIRIISISVIIVFLITAGFFIWRGFTSFDKNGVVIEIYGAERVVSGEEVKYLIKYNNNTRLVLENLKLVFHYPKDSIPANQQSLDETIDLPDLAPGQEKEIELLVRIIGLRGENQKAWVELSYQPVGISSQYTNVAEFISQVISVPLILDFDLPEKLGWSGDTIRNVRDIYKGNIFLDETRGEVHIGEVIEMVLDAFEMVINQGPLAREPCIKLRVSLVDTRLHEDAIHRGPAQVYPAVREAIVEAMKKANAYLFEPIQIYLIEMPDKFLSAVTKLVGGKRGQMLEVRQEGTQADMKAKLPVAEMIGWSSDLRSATEGRGTSSLLDQLFEKVPASLQPDIVRKIRQRKGLSENQ